MKQLVIGAVLAAGLGIFVQAQVPAPAPGKPSLSIIGDTIRNDSAGRAVFSGQVVLTIDGTHITADSGASYNLATHEIELAAGTVRIKLSGAPGMHFQSRTTP